MRTLFEGGFYLKADTINFKHWKSTDTILCHLTEIPQTLKDLTKTSVESSLQACFAQVNKGVYLGHEHSGTRSAITG